VDTLNIMDTQATYDDVKLIMRLYEMRREDKLREARQWFAKFNARTWAEKNELCPPGSEQDAYFRMVVTYWEMAASFITAGVLHQELFLQSGQELLFVWEKIRDILPEWRTAYGNPKVLANVETVSKAAIAFMNRGDAKAYEAFSTRVRGIR
jgi:hypothetical protein